MCLPQNAKIADVKTSPFGYDVRLDDGFTGSVKNDPNAAYYDEVQSYLAKGAPAASAAPGARAPTAGKMSLNQITGDHDQGGVRSITDAPDGGRYGMGTRTTEQVGAAGNTIDRAPATAGNIAQAAANALGILGGGPGMAATIGGMLADQATDIGGGQIAQSVGGILGGQKAPAGPAGTGKKGAPSTGGGQMNREDRFNAGQQQAQGKQDGRGGGTKGGIQGGGGGQRTADGGRARY